MMTRPFRRVISARPRLRVISHATPWGSLRDSSIAYACQLLKPPPGFVTGCARSSAVVALASSSMSSGSSAACSGGGLSGGSRGGGGSGGGGGGGDWSGPGGSMHATPNVLADLALNEAAAAEMVEEVILLDVGGEPSHKPQYPCSTIRPAPDSSIPPTTHTHASSCHVVHDFQDCMPHSLSPCTDCCAGMKCGGCVGHVKKILEAQPGVMQVCRD